MFRLTWLLLALMLPLACVLHAGHALAARAEAQPASCELADLSIADDSIAASPAACITAENSEAAAAPSEPTPADANAPAEAARYAPMCDNAGASIAAVPEVPELDRGQFEPARCDTHRWLALLRSEDRARSACVISGGGGEKPDPAPLRVRQGRFDAASERGPRWPLRAPVLIIALEPPRGLAWRAGHSPRIERPPTRR
jgi:hypothetical protein